jgi:hypothetical protein
MLLVLRVAHCVSLTHNIVKKISYKMRPFMKYHLQRIETKAKIEFATVLYNQT